MFQLLNHTQKSNIFNKSTSSSLQHGGFTCQGCSTGADWSQDQKVLNSYSVLQ